MPLFPSEEWMREFCARLEREPGSGDLADALAGVYRFVVEPGGPLRERVSYDLEVASKGPGSGHEDGRADGQGARVRLLEAPAPAPRITLSADYPRWRQLVQGQLDIPMAFMLRRLRVSGDYGSLLRSGASTRPLMAALHDVDSVWLEDVR